LNNHSSPVKSLLYLRSSNYLLSASSDGIIFIWKFSNFSRPLIFKTINYFNGINCLADLMDGRIAAGSNDSTITIWNISSGLLLATLKGHTQAVTSIVFLTDTSLASGSLNGDQSIIIWNTTTYQQIGYPLLGHSDTVLSLIVFPNGYLCSSGGSNDLTIRIWNVTEQNQIGLPLTGHTGAINSLLLLDNGLLASASEDGSIKIWNSNCYTFFLKSNLIIIIILFSAQVFLTYTFVRATAISNSFNCPTVSPFMPQFLSSIYAYNYGYPLNQAIACLNSIIYLTCPSDQYIHIYSAYFGNYFFQIFQRIFYAILSLINFSFDFLIF